MDRLEADRWVGSTSPIDHGWRPCSATYQPVCAAIHGNGRLSSAHLSSQGLLSSFFFAEAQKAQANSASIRKPEATMARKLQNRLNTWGMVSLAASWICSSLASTTLAVYFFSSRP
ncbi:hypothetical protein D3C81_1859680 [compost metagenome]